SRHHGDYVISDDPALVDVDLVYAWLADTSYWAKGRTRETVQRSIANSIPLGVYHRGATVGFARVVTDRATFAWLCDVFVVEEHRGSGLGKALVEAAVTHPDLQEVKRFVLATADAHDLYRQYGFEVLDRPDRWMIRRGDTA
ncbi:MAG: GNAT family N-acetyltransferase, partial [Actinomycetota bacterium]